jgi:hypothetical protein
LSGLHCRISLEDVVLGFILHLERFLLAISLNICLQWDTIRYELWQWDVIQIGEGFSLRFARASYCFCELREVLHLMLSHSVVLVARHGLFGHGHDCNELLQGEHR